MDLEICYLKKNELTRQVVLLYEFNLCSLRFVTKIYRSLIEITMAGFLNDIQKFSKDKLKPTETETYHLSGKRFLRKAGETEEVEIEPFKVYPLDEKDTVDYYKNKSAYWSRQCGYIVDIQPDYSIHEIIDGLYISGEDVATDRDLLAKHGVTHILNLTKHVENKFKSEITYKQIEINDLPSVAINPFFADSFQFIDSVLNDAEATKQSKLLVHCHAGVSRSASFIIAYLMQKRIYVTYDEAYEHLKRIRPIVQPNRGFVKQLKTFQKKLADK